MKNVLRAYAAYDPEVGYCQGMNFLAGMLLLYLPVESDAFGALVILMKERGLRDLYTEDMSFLEANAFENFLFERFLGFFIPAQSFITCTAAKPS